MKKLICIVLALLLLAGCGAAPETTEGTTQPKGDGKLRATVAGSEVVFEAWEQEGMPTEGSWYLTRDVELTQSVVVTGQLKLHLNGHVVTGAKDVDFGQMFDVAAGGELVLCDEAEGTGAIISPRSFSAMPYVKHVIRVAGTMTMAGGTVDATAVSLENVANGAAFSVEDGGVLNIEGGTVLGGTTLCYSLDPTKNVPIDSEPADTPTEPVEGATEPAATEPAPTEPAPTEPAPTEPVTTEPVTTEPVELPELFGKGGAVYVAVGGTLNLSGGTIHGGSAGLGGSVYLEEDAEKPGTMNMSGGLVTGGETIFHGGNIYIAGLMNMSGGEIAEGQAYNHGGNLVVTGTLEMTGGTLRAGRCDAGGMGGKRGGNILVNGLNAVVHIANAQILDGDGHGGENFGGSISVIGQCAREFSVVDTVISGGQGHRGGNLYFGTLAKDVNPENLDFYMKNVIVRDGTCSYRGANLCMDSDLKEVYVVLVMDDCTLDFSEDSAKENVSLGAGAANYTWTNLTMNGGAVVGGSVTLYGLANLVTNGTQIEPEMVGGSGNFTNTP